MSLGAKGPLGIPGSGGGAASPAPVPVVPSPGATSATIEWPAVEGATGYEVFTGPSLTGPWTSVDTTTETEYDLTGLTPDTTTYASVTATVVSAHGAVSFVTAASTTQTLHKQKSLNVMFGNGMINTTGTLPVEGAISGAGRIYKNSVSHVVNPTYQQARTVYGVRFALANQRQNTISGGKLIVAISDYWSNGVAPDNYPLTENLATGWKSAQINGDTNLPISAAPINSISVAWTDWLMLPVPKAFSAYDWNISTEFLHPGQSSSTDYTLTYAIWGENDYERASTLGGHGRLVTQNLWYYGEVRKYSWYADWDGVTPIHTIPHTTFEQHYSPNNLNRYGPPGPGSSPIISIQYLMEAP